MSAAKAERHWEVALPASHLKHFSQTLEEKQDNLSFSSYVHFGLSALSSGLLLSFSAALESC